MLKLKLEICPFFKKNRTGKLVVSAVIIHPRMPMTVTMMCMGRRPHRSMIPGLIKLPANIAKPTRDAAIGIETYIRIHKIRKCLSRIPRYYYS